ncbi:DNA replication licensing factor Mcm3 [Lepeophtheirus salmonis]|uniref:DNA replication licensing factor MCM3 n=1 Tax=Lepeophtheirus salmonis TaxID=72036 RepID=A0A0K2UAA2_LEPSM|nr:DNA replication licensing factor Mcm3-like [Lepeophtheirus salmonis]
MSVDEDQRLRDIQRQYVEYLEESGSYEDRIKEILSSQVVVDGRLLIDLDDLRKKYPLRSEALALSAHDEVCAFTRALREYASALVPSKNSMDRLFLGFEGSFGAGHLTPRSLSSSHLGGLLCVEGIVTRISLVRPKVVKSVHYCPTTGKTLERAYTDSTDILSSTIAGSSGAYPTTDEDGNALQTEFGLSSYKNHQTLGLQELPEKAPTGQLPRSVDVILENDLVDSLKPGDRVQIIGVFRCLPGKKNGFTTGTFKTVLIATNVICRDIEISGSALDADDILMCKKICKRRKDIFELLAHSLAPSIHGHDHVKKALLCMLLGGVEKVLPNGSRIRGDINILLIGDPSVAKSQMLRYVLKTAPRAITTTGRGSSGVGLTAAVTTDQETGERRLEAGAMVLADRGVVCIDEFDKMTDMDRTAIHEVMEQGRVTISKAGIHARLNARCSVLAAANPVFGRYDPFKPPMENIGLQDSLLSRFDLLFVLLDTVDVDSDRKIADHVVRVHRYRDPNEEDGAVTIIDSEVSELTTKTKEEDNEGLVVWDKQSSYLNSSGKSSRRQERLTPNFIKKYVEIAKCIKPTLTEESCEIIGEEYARLRSADWNSTGDVARTQPVTARALETLIRLSCAHAKARLSKIVNKQDALAAIELVQFAYFKKVLEKEKKRRHESDSEEDTNGNVDSEDEAENQETIEESSKKDKKTKRIRVNSSQEEENVTPSMEVDSSEVDVSSKIGAFKKELMNVFSAKHAQSLDLKELKSQISEKTGMTSGEIMACIDKMSDENKIMLSNDTVYLI